MGIGKAVDNIATAVWRKGRESAKAGVRAAYGWGKQRVANTAALTWQKKWPLLVGIAIGSAVGKRTGYDALDALSQAGAAVGRQIPVVKRVLRLHDARKHNLETARKVLPPSLGFSKLEHELLVEDAKSLEKVSGEGLHVHNLITTLALHADFNDLQKTARRYGKRRDPDGKDISWIASNYSNPKNKARRILASKIFRYSNIIKANLDEAGPYFQGRDFTDLISPQDARE